MSQSGFSLKKGRIMNQKINIQADMTETEINPTGESKK